MNWFQYLFIFLNTCVFVKKKLEDSALKEVQPCFI